MSDPEAIVFYWRPGCGFCMGLDRQLTQLGIPLEKRNIWDDPEHAATVRSIAGGNETVPTVVIGDARLVNPTAAEVLREMQTHAPHLVPDVAELPEAGRTARAINRLLGGDG